MYPEQNVGPVNPSLARKSISWSLPGVQICFAFVVRKTTVRTQHIKNHLIENLFRPNPSISLVYPRHHLTSPPCTGHMPPKGESTHNFLGTTVRRVEKVQDQLNSITTLLPTRSIATLTSTTLGRTKSTRFLNLNSLTHLGPKSLAAHPKSEVAESRGHLGRWQHGKSCLARG